MGKTIAHHVVASGISIIIAFFIVMNFIAKPLTINTYAVEPVVNQPGGSFKVHATGQKAWWATRGCETTESHTYVSTSDNRITEYKDPAGYNDGTVQAVSLPYRLPVDASLGIARVWTRVVYNCFRMSSITITTPKVDITIAESANE